MKQIIGIDIDGVLANFNAAYRHALFATTGRDLIPEEVCRGSKPGEEPPVWNYAPYYGYTREEDRETWKNITESSSFWMDLKPLPQADDFLERLDCRVELDPIGERPEVYFITTRPGYDVKGQSTRWLSARFVDFPTVLITRGNKGQLAKGLGLTHFIDDKPENCTDVKHYVPECHVFLLSCRYNEAQQGELRAQGITVVHTLNQFEAALLQPQIAKAA